MLITVENCDSRYGVILSAVFVGRDNVGCKPKYKNAAELSEAVEKYFEDCKGHAVTDSDGEVATNKYGVPIIIGSHPPTVTGLALALGFKTRQSLLDYQAKSAAFNDIITVAKSRCEEYAESRLYDRDGVNGAKFSLTNNFKGWREKSESVPEAEAEKPLLYKALEADDE